MATIAQKETFIMRCRNTATMYLKAVERLRNCQKQWHQMMKDELTDADFVGENEGLNKNNIAELLTITITEIEKNLDSGYGKKIFSIVTRFYDDN